VPTRRNDDEDDLEVAIVRGRGARQIIESLAGGDGDDDDDEFEDDEGNVWQKVASKRQPARRSNGARRQPAKRSSGGFSSTFFGTK
jgi:hypothetical protein